jgi:hypothetical protein
MARSSPGSGHWAGTQTAEDTATAAGSAEFCSSVQEGGRDADRTPRRQIARDNPNVLGRGRQREWENARIRMIALPHARVRRRGPYA